MSESWRTGQQWEPEWASSGSIEENGVSKVLGCRGKSAHGGEMGLARASCPRKGFGRPAGIPLSFE